jgi:hypothetical protein
MPAKAGIRSYLKTLDSSLPDCVVIDKNSHNGLFAIPGLTRNPVLFQGITILDAGSSPA